MKRTFLRKNLAWLEARIGEAEKKISDQKTQLAFLEDQGMNTAQTCRSLAVTTEYLQLLHVRRDAALHELDLMKEKNHER